MADFREFLKTSKPIVNENRVIVSELNNNMSRIKVLQEMTAAFCKKFGEFGADALDAFFKESVERMLGTKSITEKTNSSVVLNPTKDVKNMNLAEHASAILEGDNFNPQHANLPVGLQSSSKQDDMVSRAMSIMN